MRLPLLCLALAGLAAAEPGRANLLDDPGLDLGGEAWILEPWQGGAAIDRRAPAWELTDPHSPPRCLRLPGGGDSLVSRRYDTVPGRSYVLSAWLRLAGPAAAGPAARLFLITPDWQIASTEVAATALAPGEWRRVVVRFTASERGSAYRNSVYVRLDPLADLLADSFQLEQADAPGPWQGGPQVGLSCPLPDQVAPLGAAPVDLALAGAPAGARVRLALRDGTGAERWRGEAAAAARLAVPLARRGVHRLDAELVDAGGAVLATAACRMLAVDPAEPVPAHALVGIDTDPLTGGFARLEQSERLAAGLGAGFARTFFKAHRGERHRLPCDGEELLAYAAAALDPALQRGKTVMVVAGPDQDSPLSIHRWRQDKRIADDAAVEAEIPRLAARLGRIAAAMRGRVASIEVLNEPNIWIVAGRCGMPAERYARVLAACAPAIRAAAPGMLVAANVNGTDHAYVEALLRAGAGAHIDQLTVHPYRADAENPPLHADLVRLRAVVERFRPGLPIINSEQYYCCLDRFSEHEHDRNYAAPDEADMAGRTIQSLLHQWAAEGSPYTLFQPASSLWRTLPAGEVRYAWTYGLVRAAARLLAGCGRGEDLAAPAGCRAFRFVRGDRAQVVALTTRERARRGVLTLPAGAQAFDAEGNPLAGPAAEVGWWPLYLVFPAASDPAEVRRAIAAAAVDGLDFPLALRFGLDADGAPRATVVNRGGRPAAGTLSVVEAPAGWPRATVAVPELAPGASAVLALPGAGALPRFAGGGVRWRAACGAAAGEGQERLPALAVPRLRQAVTVDGDLGEWADAAWTALAPSRDFDPRQPRQGEADCSARVALAWDARGLWLALAVRDDRAAPAADPRALWDGDGAQLYLDPRLSARAGAKGYGPGQAVWSLGWAGEAALAVLERNPGDRFVGEANAETGPDPLLRPALRRTADGWTMELLLPAAALPGLGLEPGARCGLGLLVNDHDGRGRKQGATLGPPGSEPYQDPWIWPVAELME